MANQLRLDFTPKPILDGKKGPNITIPCSENFRNIFDQIVKLYKTDRAKLGHQFLLEGMKNALGNAFISEPYLNEKLIDLIKK